MSITIHRAGAKHIFVPSGSLGVRACSAGEIGGTSGVTSTWSVQLDGTDDYITLGTSAALSPANLSFSCWVKASGSPTIFNGILGRSTTTAWQDGWGVFWNSDSEIRFFIGRYNIDYAAVTGVSPNVWNHIAGSWDGSTIKLYLNGVAGTDGIQTGSQTATTQQLDVGRLVSDSWNYYGLIDDPRIYNTAITPTDVANLAAGLDVTTGLVAYWPLEEGSGTNTVDTVGGNDGTLSGATWSTDVPAALA